MAESEQVTLLTWPSVSGGPAIQLPADIARELARRVSEAANALPRRGLEVGGLLLGKKTADVIEVESLVPLQSGYPEGPAFRVTESELRQALQSVEELGEVVGIYRSRTDGSLDLDYQDELLLRLLDGQPIPALLVRQRKDVPGEGRLLIWGGESGVTSVGPTFPLKDWLAGTWEQPIEPVEVAVISPVHIVRRRSLPSPWAIAAVLALLAAPFLLWRVQVTRTHSGSQKPEPRLIVQSSPSVTPPAAVPVPVQKPPEQTTPAAILKTEPATRSRIAEPDVTREPEIESKPVKQAAVRRFLPPPKSAGPSLRFEVPRATAAAIPPAGVDLRNLETPIPPPVPTGALDAAPPVAFTQPVLAQQPRPVALPPDLRRLLQHEVVLSLRIAVDANGRVSQVYPTSDASRPERSLWNFYAEAVRSWIFEPARRNNVPVPGEIILRFRVTPNVSR